MTYTNIEKEKTEVFDTETRMHVRTRSVPTAATMWLITGVPPRVLRRDTTTIFEWDAEHEPVLQRCIRAKDAVDHWSKGTKEGTHAAAAKGRTAEWGDRARRDLGAHRLEGAAATAERQQVVRRAPGWSAPASPRACSSNDAQEHRSHGRTNRSQIVRPRTVALFEGPRASGRRIHARPDARLHLPR